MGKLRWFGVGVAWLACMGVGCGGNAVTEPGNGGSAGAGGSAGSGGLASCSPDCAAPPPGCRFDGEPTCDPPACPPIVCEDAGVADADADVSCVVDCAPPPPGCHYEGEVSCDPPQCPPLVCEDAATDAPMPVDAPTDSSLPPDPDTFAEMLNGVWLIGWSGGMNHFSWVRLSGGPQWGGDAEFLAGDDLFANAPFWDCTGLGSWMITAKPYTVGLQFPASCSTGFASYTFLTMLPAAGYPPGAVVQASLEDPTNPGATLEGYRFPSDWCDPTMTTCPDPWQ
jgi:hypothetical protein